MYSASIALAAVLAFAPPVLSAGPDNLPAAALAAHSQVSWNVLDGAFGPRHLTAPWLGEEEWILRALVNGTVLRTEPIGHGITNPFKAEIEFEERRIQAVWKPLRAGDFREHESYPAEIAAYRLSRYLGLDMVPPTVERKLGRRTGSMQFWVHDYDRFAKVKADRPYDFFSSDQIQMMRFFDALIDNPDRNAGNYLVNEDWQIVLIDHSRSMFYDTQGSRREGAMPKRFLRTAVERLEALDLQTMRELLGDQLHKWELRGLMLDRKQLLRFVEKQVDEHGEVLFFDTPRPILPPPTALTQADLN